MTPGQRAEALIAELYISDPKDLDVEAIAIDAGITIEYRDLVGCEATLAGYKGRAIASVKPSSVRGRERFSIGHELGHWKMHRGQSFRCRVEEVDVNILANRVIERDADQFAAHLLMPGPLFNPAVKSIGQPSFREIEKLAADFQTSTLATSLRLVNVDTLPVVLACYSKTGKRWGIPAAHVPRRWFLKNELDPDSFAYDLLAQGKEIAGLRKQSGEVWFQNSDAEDHELFEHCIPYRNGDVLVLLYLSKAMMDAGFDPHAGDRRYNEHGSYVRHPGSKR